MPFLITLQLNQILIVVVDVLPTSGAVVISVGNVVLVSCGRVSVIPIVGVSTALSSKAPITARITVTPIKTASRNTPPNDLRRDVFNLIHLKTIC